MEDIRIIIPQNSRTDSQLDTVVCYQIIEEYPSVESDPVMPKQIVEEGPSVTKIETQETPHIVEEGPRVTEIETEETTQTVEDRPRSCPLCSSEIKYFFIDFTEKLLMCENGECEFPFGYEDLQFKRFEYRDDTEMTSIQNCASQYSDSLNSSAAHLGKEKANNVVCEGKFNHKYFVPKQKSPKEKRLKIKKVEIKNNLEYMEKRNMQLHDMNKSEGLIWNQKWIHNLKNLQETSGLVLLDQGELNSISVKNNNEVKLDIEKGDDNNVCSIKILMTPSSSSDA